VAVPYRPVATGRFRVHEPRVLKWEKCEDFDVNVALERFFEGVRSHPDTVKYWDPYFEKF
jgi:hypothetical protein